MDETVQLISDGEWVTVSPQAAQQDHTVIVEMGLVLLETSFTRLAWAGGNYNPPSSSMAVEVPVGGAEVDLFSRSTPDDIWFANETSPNTGTLPAYLPRR